MATIGVYQLKQQAGVVRRTMSEGNELAITFHDKPIGVLVPHDQLEQERAELGRLRDELDRLQAEFQTLQAKLGGDNKIQNETREVPAA